MIASSRILESQASGPGWKVVCQEGLFSPRTRKGPPSVAASMLRQIPPVCRAPHNDQNGLCRLCRVPVACLAPREIETRVCASFQGLPQRSQSWAERAGLAYVNDKQGDQRGCGGPRRWRRSQRSAGSAGGCKRGRSLGPRCGAVNVVKAYVIGREAVACARPGEHPHAVVPTMGRLWRWRQARPRRARRVLLAQRRAISIKYDNFRETRWRISQRQG